MTGNIIGSEDLYVNSYYIEGTKVKKKDYDIFLRSIKYVKMAREQTMIEKDERGVVGFFITTR